MRLHKCMSNRLLNEAGFIFIKEKEDHYPGPLSFILFLVMFWYQRIQGHGPLLLLHRLQIHRGY
jgi:hypothetical protein